MAILEIIDKQNQPYGLGFRTGGKICFFSHSLYWLMRHVGLTELKVELLDDGESVLYGEMSYKQIEALVNSGKLNGINYHLWGISWSFRGQSRGSDDDFSGYPEWRNEMLKSGESEGGKMIGLRQ